MLSGPELCRINIQVTVFVILCAVFSAMSFSASAQTSLDSEPAGRDALENIPKINKKIDEEGGLPFDLRGEAMREAALSYGARGGLAWRTWQIRKTLEERANDLNRIYNFQTLLIPAPSGLLIEPPVISESTNAMIIESSGTEAAVADKIYDMNANARIVSAPRSWRNYLERNWGDVEPPPDILRPNDEEEREKWITWIREGWQKGTEQADEIFAQDLKQLNADFQGMVRYRTLLAQSMVSPPYTTQLDRGITGGGNKMRIGDRIVQITTLPQLNAGAESWQPANR